MQRTPSLNADRSIPAVSGECQRSTSRWLFRLTAPSLGLATAFSLLLSLLLIGAPALAQDKDEPEPLWYVEYQAGFSFMNDIDLDVPGRTDFDLGYSLGGAFGRRLLDRFRVEFHLGYSDADVDNINVSGGPGDGTGGASLFAVMANAYYDLDRDLDFDLGFTPWIGAGVGWGSVEMRARSDIGTNQLEVSDTDSIFVYNVMAGGTVPVTDVVEITLRYRYLSTSDIDVKGRVGSSPRRFDAKFEAHQAIAGMRIVF